MRNNDEFLRKIANSYVEQYGENLKEELKQEEQSNVENLSVYKLEKRVRKQITAQKRKPYFYAATMLAACFAVIILLPHLSELGTISSTPSTSSLAAPSPSTPAPPQDFEIIPLSVNLPKGFVQSGFEQDREKSIYYIDDINNDNVVLTMEKSPDQPDISGLVEINVGNSVAYGTQTASYSLLTFNRDDVLYVLTCQHDINTLINLGEVFI